MQLPFLRYAGFVLVVTAIASTPARGQIAELGKIIADKDKKAADAVDKAGKNQGKPAAKPATKTSSKTRAAKPPAADAPFSSDTEDPMNILDITPELLGRFATGLAAETARRAEPGKPLAAAKYQAAGAEAAGITPRQYFVLKARVAPFCEAAAKGLERPLDTKLGYWPNEMTAMRPRCAALNETLAKLL